MIIFLFIELIISIIMGTLVFAGAWVPSLLAMQIFFGGWIFTTLMGFIAQLGKD